MKIQQFTIIGVALALVVGPVRGADVSAGEAAYAATCANCHGPTGRGMASFPSLAGNSPDYITERLVQYRAGEMVGPNSPLMMPMAADLSDEDIASLAAYVSETFK